MRPVLVRSVLLYLVLVGTPLVGLLLLLRTGERLAAPPAMGGTWVLDDAFADALRRGCVPLALPAERPSLTISQSGRYLQLRFNDAAGTALPGTLHAGTLTARQVLPTSAVAGRACGETALTELRLRLDARGGAARLRGRWKALECEVCPALDGVAVRAD